MRKLVFPVACGVTVVTSLAGAVLFTAAASQPFANWIDDVSEIIPPLCIVPPICVILGLRRQRWQRIAWFSLAAFGAVWGIGEAIYAYLDLVANSVPFPSWADAFFLGSIPFALTGLILLPGRPNTPAHLLRQLLDGLLIGASLAFISWVFALKFLYNADLDPSFLKTALGLAYPIGDVVLATLALSAFIRMRNDRITGAILLGGMAAFAIADTGFNYQQSVIGSNLPVGSDVGWWTGFCLVALAGLRLLLNRRRTRAGADDRIAGLPQIAAPYIPVLGAAFAGWWAEWHQGFDTFLAVDTSAILGLLLARQLATLIDNMQLSRTLETRVRERTHDLVEERVRLQRSEERFRSLVQHSSDVITIVDRNSVVSYQTDSIESALGYTPLALIGKPLTDLLIEEDRLIFLTTLASLSSKTRQFIAIDCRFRDKNGIVRNFEVRVTSLLDDPAVNGIVLNMQDVTERTVLEEQLTHQAFHDSLTELPNLALFRDRLDHGLSRHAQSKEKIGVVVLDIDGFTSINDHLGHSAGDRLLFLVAHRLAETTRPGDTVARTGGDQFAILAEGITNSKHAEQLAIRLMEALRAPFSIDDHEITVRATMGAATLGSGNCEGEELLRRAELALYRAKQHTPGGYEIYEPSLHADTHNRFDLESSLLKALDNDEFVLFYQPLINLQSGTVRGVEALLRWNHPQRGMVAPLDFIPIAERNGMIVPIGRWALRTACTQAQNWRRIHKRDLQISVNLSARQLRDNALVDDVREVLKKSGLPPHCLTLEVTETTLMENMEQAIAALDALRKLGVKLSLDDFGTGYSSFSYLRQMPVHELKIDRSFISSLGEDNSADVLARSIVGLGETLGLEVVAEGIEKDDQRTTLLGMGCNLGQGYFFSPPKPAAEAGKMLLQIFEGAPAEKAG